MSLPAQVGHRSPVACHWPHPGAHVRLIAFPHAGGGPLTFQSWAESLAPDIELWHATLPGRAHRRYEPFASEWAPLVEHLAASIFREVPTPSALVGHSLGALLAFEVARGLARAGLPPVHLFVSGRAAPETALAVELPETDGELLRHLDLLYGSVPDQVRMAPNVLEYFVPVLRADLELANAYVLRPDLPLPCPITAITGDADPIAPAVGLAGWSHHTSAECDVQVLPGGHFYLVEQETALLATIRRQLIGLPSA